MLGGYSWSLALPCSSHPAKENQLLPDPRVALKPVTCDQLNSREGFNKQKGNKQLKGALAARTPFFLRARISKQGWAQLRARNHC